MREILKVILPAIGKGLFVYGVGMAGVIAYDKLFFAQKLKKSRNTESDSGPADNPPPMRDIQCEVCGYKFIPYNDNRYTVVGKHNYGKIGKRCTRGDDGAMDVSLASCENYKTCDARWEEEEFFVEPDGTFYDYKYSEDE